ncbi:MAG TPA: twin-arginine translocation signal domain-containing protein [Planctomycetaceae bacterium]|nr:twin-arginine translocation signal domain-containing protein [Planctomycetaceae bacterium]
MNRRDFLKTAAALAALRPAGVVHADEPNARRIVTVTGDVSPDRLGATLPHEHVLVDFIGADKASPDRYDRDEVFDVALPHLKRARQAGCETLVECTPAYLGRDPLLLRRLSEASGVRILTNTGYYGAGAGKFLPAHARPESADDLARRWLREWQDGIGGTGVRPGFIKIGVDAGPLNEINQKLVRAAARTHLQSGLAIACHTGDGAAAMHELAILREERVDPSAWIWVHAQNEKNPELHRRAAEQGGWVEFDGIRPDTIDQHVGLVQTMQREGLLGRVLVSHDAGWYSVGEPGGGSFRPWTTQFEQFLPRLRTAGFSEEQIQRLTIANPAEAFTIRARAAG